MTAKVETRKTGSEADTAETTTKRVKDTLDEKIIEAQDALDAFGQSARTEVRRASDQTAQFVRENPGIALVGAVGVGVLVGLALRGRS